MMAVAEAEYKVCLNLIAGRDIQRLIRRLEALDENTRHSVLIMKSAKKDSWPYGGTLLHASAHIDDTVFLELIKFTVHSYQTNAAGWY